MGAKKTITFSKIQKNKWIVVRQDSKTLIAFLWKKIFYYVITFNRPQPEEPQIKSTNQPHTVYPYSIQKIDAKGKILRASGGITPHYPEILKHAEKNPQKAIQVFKKTKNWKVSCLLKKEKRGKPL